MIKLPMIRANSVALIMGCSMSTVYRLLHQVQHIKYGWGRYIYLVSVMDLTDYLGFTTSEMAESIDKHNIDIRYLYVDRVYRGGFHPLHCSIDYLPYTDKEER